MSIDEICFNFIPEFKKERAAIMIKQSLVNLKKAVGNQLGHLFPKKEKPN